VLDFWQAESSTKSLGGQTAGADVSRKVWSCRNFGKALTDAVGRADPNTQLTRDDVSRAKVELSKHCTAVTLTPTDSNIRISGDWDLLGGRSDGAGGSACT